MPPALKGLCHSFKIGFGLARPGDAIEQNGRELRRRHRFDQPRRNLGLLLAQFRLVVIMPGAFIRAVDVHLDRFQHALIDQPAQHGFRHAGKARQFADRRLLALKRADSAFALRGHTFGRAAGQAVFGHGGWTAQRAAARNHHSRHACHRGNVIIRRPFDQPTQFGTDWRHVDDCKQRAQLVFRHGSAGELVLLPHDSRHLPRTQRRHDDRAIFNRHAFWHPVIERAEGGVHYK